MKRLIIGVCLLIIILFFSPLGFAGERRAYLLLWNGFTLPELAVSGLLTRPGAIGLLNTRIGGGSQQEASFLSVGSGARSLAPWGVLPGFNRTEKIGDGPVEQIFVLRTGNEIKQIVHPGINQYLNEAEKAAYPLKVGALADFILAAGKQVALFGNGDYGNEDLRRLGVLVAMNSQGQVNQGDVSSNILIKDPDYPYGVRSDYQLLTELVLGSSADLVVVELGDPDRLNSYQPYLSSQQYLRLAERMIREIAGFLQAIFDELSEDDLLLVVAPSPPPSQISQGQWITPLFISAPQPGRVISATTRWPGIVTNMDIAPTILEWLEVPYHGLIGRPITTVPQQGSLRQVWNDLSELQERIFSTHQHRSVVLRILVGMQIFWYLVTLLLLIIPHKLPVIWVQIVLLWLLLLLVLPLSLLGFATHFVWGILPFVLVLWFGIKDPLRTIMGVGLVTAAALIYDVALNQAWLIRFSYLGYDPIGGARYYGIGNEYMGILIGSVIMGWVLLRQFQRISGKWDIPLFLLVLVVIASPRWGTNVGGGITASLAFAVTWLGLRNIRLTWWRCCGILLLVGVVLASLMLIDGSTGTERQSHIGQTVLTLAEGRLHAVGEIIERKLGMNYKLLRYSIWSRGLLVAIGVMGASLIWPSRFAAFLVKEYPLVVKGLVGTLAASITALIFNDSGVVAAATCIFFAATTMLSIALQLKHNLLSP